MFGQRVAGHSAQSTWQRGTSCSSDDGSIFLPSEIKNNPRARGFLTDLSNKCFHLKKSQSTGRIPLKKALTPAVASDDMAIPWKNKSVFVDSAFFSTQNHPTLQQQVSMAKQISASLSDATNRHSKGQSMYEKRKRRSPKWIHQDPPPDAEQDDSAGPPPGAGPLDAEDYLPAAVSPKNKPLLKLVMNPQGHVMDLVALKAKGLVIVEEGGLSPEICSELVKDLHSANGKGGQIFAKRKKKAEKWVVDESHPEQARPADRPTTKLTPPAPPAHELAASPGAVTPPLLLEQLYQSSPQPRFPTDGVYSPRVAQGWGVEVEGPLFPGPASELPTGGTVADIVAPEQAVFEPPPTCALSDTIEESLQLLAEKRRQRHSAATNYNTAPRGWGSHGVYYRPVTFVQALTQY